MLTPLEFFKQFSRGELLLPPPQLYELGRLLNFESFEELQKFARERQKEGMGQIFPVNIITSNGIINCLPGKQSVLY